MITEIISVLLWMLAVACLFILAATEYANNVKGGGPWRTDLNVWFVLGGMGALFGGLGWLSWTL